MQWFIFSREISISNMGVYQLQQEYRRDPIGVDIDPHLIPDFKPQAFELLHHFGVAFRSPIDRPERLAYGVDAVGVGAAEADPVLVLGDGGVCLPIKEYFKNQRRKLSSSRFDAVTASLV